MFTRTFLAGWGDMDFNAHMRNTAFLDRAADVRMMYFADNGFPVEEFTRRMIGPVVRRDEVEYFREIHLLHEITVTLATAGLSGDGSRFLLRNEIFRDDGKLAARVTSKGGWMSLKERKLVVPPDDLLSAMRRMPRTDEYQELPSSVGKPEQQ